ncbi:hypothetical protein GDO81_019666 [Engystomops pustulosus]|uniref:Secreted protein n=1 Tax=Engystomops pustulosus TaxID=76066 RepID=A0AAV6YVV3_ENGPU|nr:hypothetical protein GDO81_019666 [Engystomops pustulosus]
MTFLAWYRDLCIAILLGSVRLSIFKTPNRHASGLSSIVTEKTFLVNSNIDFQKDSNSLHPHIMWSISASSVPHLGHSELGLTPIRNSS